MHWMAILAVALGVSSAWAGKVTMYTDDTHTVMVKREKLDCKIHKNKKSSLSLGFKMSVAFAAKAGPEVTFSRETGIAWNGMSQELIRRYEELCDAHNRGHLTVSEYNRRYEKLESFYERAAELKTEIEENIFKRADKAFDELDAESAKHNPDGSLKEDVATEIKGKIKRYSKDIKVLSDEVQNPDEAAEAEAKPKKKSSSDDEMGGAEEKPVKKAKPQRKEPAEMGGEE